MNKFKGKLYETSVKFPDTDIWIDSCGEKELDYALERGSVGATSNPVIISAVVKQELPYWGPIIKKLVAEDPTYTEDEITWALIDEVGRERSKKLLPVFEAFHGKKGRLSIQTNAKYFRSAKKMLEQAIHLNTLGENMQVKIPASAAGIKAMEEATYHGISINATVCFTVPQAIAVAEAVENGLKRRKMHGLPIDGMAPICTIMIGRTDDWMKKAVKANESIIDPECLEWAGVAVIKEAYRIYNKRGYTTRLLSAAYRNHYHWSQLIGGNLAMTIPFAWHKKLNACEIDVVSRIDEPVKHEYMEQLKRQPEFIKSFAENGMKPEEFVSYGAFRNTISGFISGYDDFVKLIREYII